MIPTLDLDLIDEVAWDGGEVGQCPRSCQLRRRIAHARSRTGGTRRWSEGDA